MVLILRNLIISSTRTVSKGRCIMEDVPIQINITLFVTSFFTWTTTQPLPRIFVICFDDNGVAVARSHLLMVFSEVG